MEKFILLADYKHLKRGDTTTSKEMVRDSGYLCHLWHDGTKPLSKDVVSVNRLKEELVENKLRVAELEELLKHTI